MAGPALDRAFELIRDGEFEEAIRCLDDVIRQDPGDAKAWCGRGHAWHELGEVTNALSDYDEAIRLAPELGRAFLERGTLRFAQGALEEAVDDFTESIRLDPDDPNGYRWRAAARGRLGEPGRAIADCTEALRLAPEDPGAHVQRAVLRKEAGLEKEAIDDLDEALRLDPGLSEAYKIRSLLHQEQGESGKALEDLERGTELEARSAGATTMTKKTIIASLLQEHFESTDNLTITERNFPFRMRADLQLAISRLFEGSVRIAHFCGVLERFAHEGLNFAQLLAPNPHDPAVSVPPEYEEIDIGDAEPVRCLKNGLWLLKDGGSKFAAFLTPARGGGWVTGLKFQMATVNDPQGARIQQELFKRLEEAVLKAGSYRGKILSLEQEHPFSGLSKGILVHRIRTVAREEVVLPRKTLDLLDRNVIGFVRQRPELARLGLSTKKGLLFYGPPGTGKTHTVHYLAGALRGHTTFLVTAEQVGLLAEYMKLARLLQPSILVIEDVDLVARDRGSRDGLCSEVLLNQLLNEMDGLRPDAEILFILTTNRPETLERALASRPGRVDQAIEFPLPDEEGREKLVRLYSRGLSVPEDVVHATVKRTEKVSASFIKELMRRSAQFHLERGGSKDITLEDVGNALEELLFTGGSLNRKLLGAAVDEPEA